ncbi:hypothetical protein QL285_097509 [Trifolium repens]|nr:hypothetical protein QL285_098132 [Trifolium repens]KAK2351224.1 hypothetical protein QL285_097509 [Trifolium repens]
MKQGEETDYLAAASLFWESCLFTECHAAGTGISTRASRSASTSLATSWSERGLQVKAAEGIRSSKAA